MFDYYKDSKYEIMQALKIIKILHPKYVDSASIISPVESILLANP